MVSYTKMVPSIPSLRCLHALCAAFLCLLAAATLRAQNTYNMYSPTINNSTTFDFPNDGSPSVNDPVGHTITTTYDNRTVSVVTTNYTGTLLDGDSSGSGTYTKVFGINDNAGYDGGLNANAEYNPSKPADNNPPATPDAIYNQDAGVGLPITNIGLVNRVTLNGTIYFEFMLDVNENDNAISMNELIFWSVPTNDTITLFPPQLTAADPNAFDLADWQAWETATGALPSNSTTSFYTSLVNQIETEGGTILWSLDELSVNGTYGSGNRTVTSIATNNDILLGEVGAGSGSGDYNFLLPQSALGNITWSTLNDRFYIWVKYGTTGTFASVNFGESGGGEEIAYRRDSPSILIPEPSTYAAGLVLAGMAWLFSRRRSRPRD